MGSKSKTSYTPYNVGDYEKGYNLKDTSYMRPLIDYGYETQGVDPRLRMALKEGVSGYSLEDTADDEYDEYMNNVRSAWAALQGTEDDIERDTQKYIADRDAYDAYKQEELAKQGTPTGDTWYRGNIKTKTKSGGLGGFVSSITGGLIGGGGSVSGFEGTQGDTLWRLDNEAATNTALQSLDNLYSEQTGAQKGTYQTKVDEYNAALKAYNDLQTNRRIHNNNSRQQIQAGANQANSGSNVVLHEDQQGLIQDAAMLGKGNANDLRNIYTNIDNKDYKGGLDWNNSTTQKGLQSASLNENNAAADNRTHEATQEWSDEKLKDVAPALSYMYKKWRPKVKEWEKKSGKRSSLFVRDAIDDRK